MVTIAAGLIVRNEARCIRRCLESVRPWVDRIVVLDTGSTDATMRLARRSGAAVHQIAWPDSFAVARNAMLDLVDADWTLVIDADEWLIEGGPALRDWCGAPDRLGRVCVSSTFDADTADAPSTGRNWITRLLPRDVRYVGRVHEQVASDLPRAIAPATLGHDGYRDTQLARKRGRNRPLLLRDLADDPDNAYILYQLGKDSRSVGDHAAASAEFAKSRSLTPISAAWRHELVVASLHALRAEHRLDEALALADAEQRDWSHSPDLHFARGTLLLDRAATDPARALTHWLPQVRDAWRRCLEIGERPDIEGSVDGCGTYLARRNLEVIENQLAMFAR